MNGCNFLRSLSALLCCSLFLSPATMADTLVQLAVNDSANTPQAGLNVYAFNGSSYAGKSGVTNASGIAQLNLPDGSYRFRIDKSGTEFFTAQINHCTTPGCSEIDYQIPENVAVTVTSSAGGPEAGLNVYAFNGSSYAGKSAVTSAAGVATFTLVPGDYRFRIDKAGTQFFTAPANHCAAPGCTAVNYEVPESVAVTVSSSAGGAEAGLNVYAFNGSSYAGKSAVTNAAGVATLTLLPGDYRFRIDKAGTQFYTAPANHCTTPGCNAVNYEVPESVSVTVTSSAGGPEAGLNVYAFNGASYAGKSAVTDANGVATFTLVPGDYRFRIDKSGTQFYTAPANHCTAPGCNAVAYEVPQSVTVHVGDTLGGVEPGLNVYAFTGASYAGKSAVTNASGLATFTLLPGNYRFRIDKAGAQYFTGSANHCDVPGCTSASYLFPVALSRHVLDPALGACLDAAASAQGWSSPGDVTTLQCDGMGISRVDGLQGFTNLESLSLTNNPLTRLGPLNALHNLTMLNLDGNTSVECRELGSLVTLLGSGVVTSPSTCLGEGELLFSVANPDQPFTALFGQALAATALGDLLASAMVYDVLTGTVGGHVSLLDGTNGAVLMNLLNPAPAANRYFGWALAATPDNDLVVGAWQEDGNNGAVFRFDGSDGSLLQMLTSPAPTSDDRFGYAVAVSPTGHIAVGAPGTANGGTVYLFDSAGALQQTLSNPTSDPAASFGQALAISTDGDLIIGAPAQTVSGASEAGAVHVYENVVNSFTPALILENPNPVAFDRYGGVVATGASGDILVSARQQDNAAENDGGVFVHDAGDGTLRWFRANPLADAEGRFGAALAATPQGHVVVGSAFDDNGAINSGRVFVFDGDDGSLLAPLDNPNPQSGAHFGEALAMSYSGQVAVGAGGADGGAGRVYLFTSIAAGEEHTLLDDLDFDDPALKACVESQAALNGWATTAELTSLNCAGAGLASLAGLEDLDSLDSLDLSDNPGLLCSELDTLEAALPNTTLTRPEPCSTDAGSRATPQAVQYLYNAQGQRVARTLDNDPATTVHYLYDQAGLLLAEIEASTGATLREYIYLNGQPVAVVDDTGTTEEAIYYVHNDHLGTPQKLTDTNQQVVWAADYEPFGKANVTVAAVEYNQRFPGQYEDSETGLHYNYFRDYDPETGRYFQSDPIGLDGGINTYAYALNSPLRYADPKGLQVQVAGALCLTPMGWVACGAAAGATLCALNQACAQALADAAANACEALGNAFDGMFSSANRPPGFLPGDKGADEWGRRNGVGAQEGRRRFHQGIKGRDPMARPKDDYSTNPDTGEVRDPAGDYAGNLNNDYD